MPGAAFEAAVKQSRELKAKPSDDELLQVGHSDLTSIYASFYKIEFPNENTAAHGEAGRAENACCMLDRTLRP